MTQIPTVSPRAWAVRVCGQTDVGRRRTNNEDSYLISGLDASPLAPGTASELDLARAGTLLVVADGLGGANAGEVASGMAVELIHQHTARAWKEQGEIPAGGLLRTLVDAVEYSNREIRARGLEDASRRGMASTCVVAGVMNGQAFLCNVGDSRAYLVRGRDVTQVTRDQSFAQHLIDAGAIKPEDAARLPNRHVVMEALGVRDQVNVAQVEPLELHPGDIFVLCSDGLSEHVDADEIGQVVSASRDPAVRCQRLVDLANERGGCDNITVIVAEVALARASTVPLPPTEVGSEVLQRWLGRFLATLLAAVFITLVVLAADLRILSP